MTRLGTALEPGAPWRTLDPADVRTGTHGAHRAWHGVARAVGNPPVQGDVSNVMSVTSLAVTWDYRCPLARNAAEHLVVALEAGAPFEVLFVPFSLSQAHVEEGGLPVWHDPERQKDLLAAQVGIVVRDRFPNKLLHVHAALFALRHDEGGDLRDQAALASVLEREGVDPGPVFEEISSGWPLDEFRKSHEAVVADYEVFGVPTFIAGREAAFVRIMTRPQGDAALATRRSAEFSTYSPVTSS